MAYGWGDSIRNLATGYFASVMATGIVSIALFLKGVRELSAIWFAIAIALYVLMIGAYLLRLVWFPREVWRDLTSANKVFGYFTFIAGTDVLGTRFTLSGIYSVAMGLGIAALVSWLVLTYFILTFLLFYNTQPVEKVINGSWLVITVSCESLAALGSALADYLPHQHTGLLFVAYAFWSLGIILYLIFIALIMHRFFFYPMTASDLSPPYWINMGAMAITTLAGSRLVLYPHATTFLLSVRPFVQGFTIMLWVWGTWWIPFLVLIGIWKYFVYKERFAYEPNLWSMVFPLGMYTAACETMSSINGLHFVHILVSGELWTAVTAWTVVAISFLVQLFGKNRAAAAAQHLHKAG